MRITFSSDSNLPLLSSQAESGGRVVPILCQSRYIYNPLSDQYERTKAGQFP
jgi:hypothetical protein